MKLVEQVDRNGDIYFDYDISLSSRSIFNKLLESFPNLYKDEEGMICGEFNGHRYALRVKNVTYLGHPHPLFKKRIQISNDLQDYYLNAKRKGYTPLLLGIYTSKDCTLFCDFHIEDFINKKAHNSSAHVMTSDLAEAAIEGYFYKEDYFGNRITVVTPATVSVLLSEKLEETQDTTLYTFTSEYGQSRVASDIVAPSTAMWGLNEVEKAVMDFFETTPRIWNGIECYQDMIAADYRNKYQPEWPGFFLEYRFEKYIQTNHLERTIRYAQDKKQGGIDLDLYFPKLAMYGDLKAHSSHSKAVQGNDWGTIFGLIDDGKKENHIYYIVCEHDTEKDSEHDFKVTKFWNTVQQKDDIMSYSKRMKSSVQLTHAYILDIYRGNKQYLTKFKQGINSNGKPREPKIMIEQDKFSKFVLTEREL